MIRILLTGLLAWAYYPAVPSLAAEPADRVFTHARLFTGDEQMPWASAAAVRDGHFVYVGDDASAFVGPDTRVHDLGGRMAIPGIIDSHAHPGYVALSNEVLLVEATDSKDAFLEALKQKVQAHPEREVLVGGFWPNAWFGVEGPHKAELDAIESERPLLLYDDWGHSVWANSAALAQAGVTRDTPDLVPGFSFYQKDASGEPSGWVTESAATVFMNHFASMTPTVEATLLEYLEYFRDMGVTTLLDAGNFGLDREVYAAVSRLDQDGRLPVRFHGAYTLFTPDGLDDAVATLKQLGEDFNSELVRIDTLKVFFDGVLETRTAALSQDYLDMPGNDGEVLFGREALHQLILDLEAHGFNLHVHTVGDRAVTTVLDAVEAARASLGRPLSIRVSLAHLEVVTATDYARFRELDITANFTPHWWVSSDNRWTKAGIGEKAESMQRAQPLISDGARVTFSSDNTTTFEWRSGRSSPYLGMQVGHNRQDVGIEDPENFMAPLSERLQRKDLLLGYTAHGAYQLGREDELGRIATGLKADLVVMDRHLLEVGRFQFHDAKPVAVILDGEVVSGSLD